MPCAEGLISCCGEQSEVMMSMLTNGETMTAEAWGYQMLLDCYGCPTEHCVDIDRGYEFLEDLAANSA